METLNVDLEWSLWSAEREHWDEYAKDAYDRIAKAFTGEAPPVCVYTAPRKEIRYGEVFVSQGKARVTFQAGWDEPFYQVPSEISEDKHDEVIAEIENWHRDRYGFIDSDMPAGAIVEGGFVGETFADLMQHIDDLENMLLEREAEQSDEFDDFLNQLVERYTSQQPAQEKTP